MLPDITNKIDNLMKILIEITRDREIKGRQRTNVETLITIHVH